MQTLPPATTLQWIKRLTAAIDHCHTIINTVEHIPNELWHAARHARTEAIIVRDELLELTVSTIEVEEV